MTGGTSCLASSDSSSWWCPWRMTSGAASQKDRGLSLVTYVVDIWDTCTHFSSQFNGQHQHHYTCFNIIPHFVIVMSFSKHCFPGIIAVNAVVLCCWRIPLMQRSMIKYFTSNPASSECAGWADSILVVKVAVTSQRVFTRNRRIHILIIRKCHTVE